MKYDPVYELINSLDFFLKNQFKKSDFNKTWVRSVQKDLSPYLFKELSLEENLINLSLFKTLVFTSEHGFKDTEKLIQWFESLNKDWVKKYLLEIQACTELPPSFFKVSEIVRRWEEEYFKYVDANILKNLEADAKSVRESLPTSNETDIIEQVTKGIRLIDFPSLEKVILVPQYHGRPINLINQFSKIHIYCYPSYIETEIPNEPDELILQGIKALSDKSRLKILRFMWEHERTFNEIQKHTKLARSTVHYHLVLLRSAGLIRIYISPGKNDRFQIRKEGLEQMQLSLHEFLKN